jgi:hypothetical protein
VTPVQYQERPLRRQATGQHLAMLRLLAGLNVGAAR